jgi:hypothetical protein
VVAVLKNWQCAPTRIGLFVHLSDNVSQVPGVVRRRLKDTPYMCITSRFPDPTRRDDVACVVVIN